MVAVMSLCHVYHLVVHGVLGIGGHLPHVVKLLLAVVHQGLISAAAGDGDLLGVARIMLSREF